MRIISRLILLAAVLLCLWSAVIAAPLKGKPRPTMTAEQQTALLADVDKLIKDSGAETVSVAFRDLATGQEVMVNADAVLHPASTIKLALMAEVFHQAAQGKLSLDERIPIVNEFHSSMDDSVFSLTASDDSETTLYKRIGETETIRELCRLMEVRSSNLATNLLRNKVGPLATTAYMQEIGAGSLVLRNNLFDMKAFNAGKTNLATARGLCVLLTRLAERKLVSPEASDAMIAILKGQEFKSRIPAGLPSNVVVAHKTGSIEKICHDAGIIYPPGKPPYILVVLTRGLAENAKAEALIAAISKRFYAAANP